MSRAQSPRSPSFATTRQRRRSSIASPQAATPQKVRVNVAIRVRPLNKLERRTNQVDAWSYDKNNEIVQSYKPWEEKGQKKTGKKEAVHFRFDKIFIPEETNEDVQNHIGRNVVDFVMKGYHGCLFAYGQTSAGKTHTIHGYGEDPGVLPRSIELIFKYIEEAPEREFVLRISFFEVYNEVVNDLLAPQNVNLRIREDRKRGVFLEGLKEEVVMSPEQVLALLSVGQSHRHVGRTNYNAASSRSHTVFRLVVESAEKSVEARQRRSVLNIVDLAGSENAVKAGRGSRVKETGYINKSLLTLGHVMKSLSEKKSGHVPYRNSKLTRILQNSLSGQAAVAVVCCISPSSANLEETISTLKFAARAKKIKASVQVNYDKQTLLKQYRDEIERLKKEVADLRQKAAHNSVDLTSAAVESTEKQSKEVPLDEESRMIHGDNPIDGSLDGFVRKIKEDSKTSNPKDSDEFRSNSNMIRERKARIDQLTRIILKSSRASMPKEMGDVIAKKLEDGQISLDEFTHIKRVIQKAEHDEHASKLRIKRPSLTKRSRSFNRILNIEKIQEIEEESQRRRNSTEGGASKNMITKEDSERMLKHLKDISAAQAEEIIRLKKENEELRAMNIEKDEALNEWDMFYQNMQNKPEHDADSLAAQVLVLETQMEEEREKFNLQIESLQQQLAEASDSRDQKMSLPSTMQRTSTTNSTSTQPRQAFFKVSSRQSRSPSRTKSSSQGR
mmetsp:Transcript_14465/g.35260  ORF Transcript_14465/g.35260 Transcript_14465/m.35260 type:complete len:729 (+) Transcript_14465:170-2356(+)